MKTVTDIPKFIETVDKMRNAQKEFFRTKATSAINEAKKLEKEVDAMLDEGTVPSRNNQSKLF
ncbi:hypothetical protein [Pedobacter sp. Leaf170]|uniref:hypothetical protein n=1 Tax=Pedobacter sp. Leaf170 TaxID=2876558 RepID=UPI001E40A859|nr:hypothetical protein [Pedobacter sp. Leaf170]